MATYTSTNNYIYFIDNSDGILKFRVKYTLTEDTSANTYTITLTEIGLSSNALSGEWHMTGGDIVINGETISYISGTTVFTGVPNNNGATYSTKSPSGRYSPLTVGPFSYDTYPTIISEQVDRYLRWMGTSTTGNPHQNDITGTTSSGGTLTAPHAHSHSYTSSITTPATCTSSGIKTYTCECGKIYTETIAALGHNYKFSKTVAPTCTAQGYDLYVCQSDSSHTEKRNYTDMIGHNYVDTIISPTCTEQGYTLHTCSNCGHNIIDTPTAALGHIFGEWVVTKEPAFQQEGEAQRTCSRCKTVEKKILEALKEALFRAITWISGNKYIVKIAKEIEGKLEWFDFVTKIGNKDS